MSDCTRRGNQTYQLGDHRVRTSTQTGEGSMPYLAIACEECGLAGKASKETREMFQEEPCPGSGVS